MSSLVERASFLLSRCDEGDLFRNHSRNLLLGYCEQITKDTTLLLDEMNQLNELSMRTGAIAVYVMKVKQYANKVTSNVSKLKTLASRLDSSTNLQDRNKIDSEVIRLSADNDENKRKMIMYSTLVSAAGGFGNDRTYKLLKKQTTKRKR